MLLATAGLGALTQPFVVPYFGRVVRNTRATPENIAARKNIRERGLALHAGDYDRIIVVGHSLGSVVAYDLISYFWAARTVEVGTDEHAAPCELEKAIPNAEKDPLAFLKAQRAFLRALRRRDRPEKEGDEDGRWLITDLVTLGSPLAHAEFSSHATATTWRSVTAPANTQPVRPCRNASRPMPWLRPRLPNSTSRRARDGS